MPDITGYRYALVRKAGNADGMTIKWDAATQRYVPCDFPEGGEGGVTGRKGAVTLFIQASDGNDVPLDLGEFNHFQAVFVFFNPTTSEKLLIDLPVVDDNTTVFFVTVVVTGGRRVIDFVELVGGSPSVFGTNRFANPITLSGLLIPAQYPVGPDTTVGFWTGIGGDSPPRKFLVGSIGSVTPGPRYVADEATAGVPAPRYYVGGSGSIFRLSGKFIPGDTNVLFEMGGAYFFPYEDVFSTCTFVLDDGTMRAGVVTIDTDGLATWDAGVLGGAVVTEVIVNCDWESQLTHVE